MPAALFAKSPIKLRIHQRLFDSCLPTAARAALQINVKWSHTNVKLISLCWRWAADNWVFVAIRFDSQMVHNNTIFLLLLILFLFFSVSIALFFYLLLSAYILCGPFVCGSIGDWPAHSHAHKPDQLWHIVSLVVSHRCPAIWRANSLAKVSAKPTHSHPLYFRSQYAFIYLHCALYLNENMSDKSAQVASHMVSIWLRFLHCSTDSWK